MPAFAGVLVLATSAHGQFADSVVSYDSGTGFAAGFTNSSAALGAPALGASVTPFAPPFSKSQIVSIGTNGSLTLHMSVPIEHKPADPYGVDFVVFGNSFFVSSGGNVSGVFSSSVSTRVEVSADDITWYTLNPALAPTIGILFPTDGNGNAQIPVNPSLTLSSLTSQNLAGIRSLYNGSAGGAGYDLAWAQDSGGNSVDLPEADYVRIDVLSGRTQVDAVAVIPEPAAWELGIMGLILAFFIRARKCGQMMPENTRDAGLTSRKRPISTTKQTMKKIFAAFLLSLVVSAASADTIQEDFSNNPATDGWQVFGDTNLFFWNSTNHDLEVTWDSSQTNSYFYHPLGTILAMDDDFSVAFDLQLTNAVSTGFGFELAVGFLNIDQAVQPGFIRGTGSSTPNLVEFDYFPPADFDPTVLITIASSIATNSDFSANETNYSGGGFTDPLQLTNDYAYHIELSYASSNQTLSAVLIENGTNNIPLQPATLAPGFPNFRCGTVAISSYNDARSGASILAHGVIDNIVVTVPPPPVTGLVISQSGTNWQAEFTGRTNWLYTLQRTVDLLGWTSVSPAMPGLEGAQSLVDTNPPLGNAFYRVCAARP